MTASPLTTQCPSCQHVLDVTLNQLAQARGRVACGHCHASFDALARLALHARGPAGFRTAYPRSNELPILLPQTAAPAAPAPCPTEAAPPPASPVVTPGLRRPAASEEAPPAKPFVPDFIRRGTRGPVWRRGLLAVLLLLLLAAGGWGLYRPLARLPLTGQGLAWLCSISGCQLPMMRDGRRLQLLARDVRTSAQAPHVLAVNLRLRNGAWFRQPYPTIIVHLQDRAGQPLASQSFTPMQYLGTPAAIRQGLAPSAELTVSLQMKDPGTAASGFVLNFQ